MFYIKIAEITVEVHNVYPFVEAFCKNYQIAPVSNADLIVRSTKEEIQREVELEGVTMPEDQAEGINIYRKICEELPKRFQGFLMHCAVIEYEGKGYAFAAKSGTGKTTHIRQWRKRFGKDVHVINGDKPILRFVDGSLRAYGTPWCGKEGYQSNASVPLNAICFVEQAQKNQITPLAASDALMRIFHQVMTPADEETVDTFFPLLDKTLRETPCYLLRCTISEEAAEVAYQGMNQT